MNHFLLRLAAAVLAPLLILKPDMGHCQTAPAASPAAEERLAHVSVITLGTAGSPVILIPGLATPRAVWDGVAPALAAKHRVYLVQVNGFAGDDPGQNLAPGVLDGAVADIDGYIAAHKLAGASVIGHSLGGLVGMMLAKAHPNDVSKLMIVDSLPWFGVIMTPPGMEITTAMLEPRAKAMRDRIVATYGKPADPAAIDAQTRGLALKPDSVTKMRDWVAKADPRVAGQAMYEDLMTDLRPDMATIATPITLVYPWNDMLPEAQSSGFYKAQYAKATRVTYEPVGDSAHFVMLDQPQAFAAAVARFLGDA